MNEAYYAALQAVDNEVLKHHGVLGMKWGIRRYQNPDGTLTALGRQHLEDGKTQKVIENWNRKVQTAIAKGDTKFAQKNMDLLSNQEIQAFASRIQARHSLDDLKAADRKITSDKIQSWANIAGNAATMAGNAINLYNNIAKINNTFSKNKLPVIKDRDDDSAKNAMEIFQTWKNGKMTSEQKKWTDESGNKWNVTKNTEEEQKRPETIKNVYDDTGFKTSTARTYTDEHGNNVTDTHKFSKGDDGDSSGSSSKSNPEPPKTTPPSESSQSNAQGHKGETWQKQTVKYGDRAMYPGGGHTKTKADSPGYFQEGTFKEEPRKTNADGTWKQHEYIKKIGDQYIYALPKPEEKSSKSSNNDSQPRGFKDFDKYSSMPDSAKNGIKDVDDYTDELRKKMGW